MTWCRWRDRVEFEGCLRRSALPLARRLVDCISRVKVFLVLVLIKVGVRVDIARPLGWRVDDYSRSVSWMIASTSGGRLTCVDIICSNSLAES